MAQPVQNPGGEPSLELLNRFTRNITASSEYKKHPAVWGEQVWLERNGRLVAVIGAYDTAGHDTMDEQPGHLVRYYTTDISWGSKNLIIKENIDWKCSTVNNLDKVDSAKTSLQRIYEVKKGKLVLESEPKEITPNCANGKITWPKNRQ